jgi:hypothetical protein
VIRLAIAACAEQQEGIAEPFEAIVDLIGVVLLFFLPVRTFDYPQCDVANAHSSVDWGG